MPLDHDFITYIVFGPTVCLSLILTLPPVTSNVY